MRPRRLPSLPYPTSRITSRVVKFNDAQTAWRVAGLDWGLDVHLLTAPRYEGRCVVIHGGRSSAHLTAIARRMRAWVQTNPT